MPVKKPHINVTFSFEKPATLRNRERLKQFLRLLFRKETQPVQSLSYIFCSDDYLLSINKDFLQHDYYTDIITFNLADTDGPVIGEIYISIDRVRENAKTHSSSLNTELHRVMFHGALHLCGYRDKTRQEQSRMRLAEDRILEKYFKC